MGFTSTRTRTTGRRAAGEDLTRSTLPVEGKFLLPLERVRDFETLVDIQLAKCTSSNVQVRWLHTHDDLKFEARHTLLQAFGASRVDYCNAVLAVRCSNPH